MGDSVVDTDLLIYIIYFFLTSEVCRFTSVILQEKRMKNIISFNENLVRPHIVLGWFYKKGHKKDSDLSFWYCNYELD